MTRSYQKKFFTTGDVAEICGVNFRTVIRWTEQGKLKATQLPGRGDRRITKSDLSEFLEKHDFPIPDDLFAASQNKEAKTRILIIDNEVNVANSIHRAIQDLKWETSIALDGFQAGFRMNEFSPHILTLDLKMPGFSGFEFLENLNLIPKEKRPKVLVISGLPMDQLEKAKSKGADDVLAKPYKRDVLITKLKSLLNK